MASSPQQSNLFKILTERLRDHVAAGDLEQAETIAKTAVESARRSVEGGEENLPLLLEALRELASIRLASEDVSGAELVYQEAFGLARGKRAVSASQIGMLKSELAGVLDRLGKGNEAVPLYQDAVEIFESASVDEPFLAAKLRNNLAMIFKQRGSLEMAEEHYLVALEAFEVSCGAESEEVASLYNNIGGLYQAAGHLDRAAEMHLQALELRQQLEGGDSVGVGQSLSNVAAAYHAGGRQAEADRYYKQARKVLALHRESEPEIYEIAESNHRVLQEEGYVSDDEESPLAAPQKRRKFDPVRLTRQVLAR